MPLKTRLVATTAGILLAISLFLLLVWQPIVEKDRFARWQKIEKQQMSYIGTTLVPDMLSSDLAALEGTLNRLLELNPGWLHVTLSNADGRLIYPLEKSGASYQGKSISVEIRHEEKLLGALTAFPDEKKLREDVRQEIRILGIALVGACLLTALLLGVTQLLLLIRPISLLSSGVNKVSGGDFSEKLPESGAKELVELAQAFNRMTDMLKQREGALKDDLLFQQALFESAGVGIMIQRGDLITRCNRKMEELLRFPPGSLTENTVSGLLPDIGSSFTEEAIRDGIALDLQLTRLDGSTFWARLIRSRIDKNSIVKGYIWGVSDITDILSAAQSMRIAKESAEQADHVKSMFLANMSHEIRTPMNGVIGMAQLALKTGLDNKQRDYVQKIYQSGKSLLVIINDILDFSKLEAGKLELEDKTFDLDEILSKVSTFIGPAIAKKPIELLYRLGKEVPQAVSGDPLRLTQVLTNLVGNAVKFTEKGSVTLTADLLQETEDRVLIEFRVRDTGIGMTEEQKKHIFDSFSQADISITRRFGGTGLGLAICKRIIGLMSGEIIVDSQPGAGSTFRFSIPLKKSNVVARKIIPNWFMGASALVVDDNPEARDIVVAHLKSFNIACDEADSGELAIEKATSQGAKYSVILMDWKMPGITGDMAARLIKQRTDYQPAIIMMTAFGKELLSGNQHSGSIDGFFTKPATASTIFDALIAALPQDPSSHAPGTAGSAGNRLAGVRVLLVEDNPINQQIAREFLETQGAIVAAAMNGKEAVDLLAEKDCRFDLILMDIQMPVMDGLAATKLIRENPLLGKIPIIALTAHALVSDKQRCIDAGMNDYVSKPIDLELLLSTLERWIQPTKSKQYVASAEAELAPGDLAPIETAGIDSTGAIRSMGGHLDFYVSALQLFVLTEGDLPDRIGAALSGEQRDAASQCLRTYAGLCESIGAEDLARDAAGLEQALHGSQDIQPALEKLTAQHVLTINAIKSALQAPREGRSSAGNNG
jgi:two-component system sensor histidine kinase/response regulator